MLEGWSLTRLANGEISEAALAHGAIILDVMPSYPAAACSGASSTNSTAAVPRIVKWESGNAVRTAPTPR